MTFNDMTINRVFVIMIVMVEREAFSNLRAEQFYIVRIFADRFWVADATQVIVET